MTARPTDRSLSARMLEVYAGAFVLYLLTPLIVAGIGAFNDVDFPTVSRWGGFTLKWFSTALADTRLRAAALNSLWVILGTNLLAIPLGLAGALLVSRWRSRVADLVYAALVVPLLTPGILFGIATLIFWQKFGVTGGVGLAIIAQTPELAAVSMMLFLARLHRFDHSLEEAARDLGATPGQVIRRIVIPFLAPTILSASALVTLLSFGNYNTTVFVIGAKATVTTWFGSKVRLGLTPEVNAVVVIMTIITVALALLLIFSRRGQARRSGA